MTDKLEAARQAKLKEVGTANASMRAVDVHGGVTVGWLAEVFRMDPENVRKRIADCTPLSTHKTGHRYSLPQAAAYLVKPVTVDIEKYLKVAGVTGLPTQLQDSYWAALLKKQRWEEEQGDLWRTEKVLSIFAETFTTIKSSCQLWMEDIERVAGLNKDQRVTLTALVDGLLNEIRSKLISKQVGKNVEPAVTEIIDGNDLI